MKNSVVKFEYSRGSQPGSTRRLYVTNMDHKHIYGYDLDREESRQFTLSYSKNLRVSDDEVLVMNTSLLPKSIGVDEVCSGYEDDGFEVHEFLDTIVAIKRNEDKIECTWRSFTFTTRKGFVHLSQNSHGRPVVRYLESKKSKQTEVELKSPKQFHDLLNNIL
jgi:predicted DNA-binding transcriptional regulator YafY